ncbi:phospho-sugar mutase [Clostridium cylindrosporum]|uniref:Phosphoglucomutase n=1 Tax=Clostridium cylindrosporum DSM 605 TaxID=1121307 RepID=A0A0J8DEL7_CLOCY|nr:phospho-sugar mutase [Clostridium cylindrosporum]KMT22628.1 phosphoglucomutase PgcA [Clostridium cylindrosporum DSM 605]
MLVEDTDYLKLYNQWLESDYINSDTKTELRLIKKNEREINDRFYKNLEFGTGGMRGIIGAGLNRMNIYTVRKATQGLANYLNQINNRYTNSVVIAYDSRIYSDVFAEEVSMILAGNGISVYLFEGIRTTPELSFAVRYLKCSAGIVITASHNPSEYNGYKVYGPDGGQITDVYAEGIIKCINDIDNFDKIKKIDKKQAIEKKLFRLIGEEIDREYVDRVKNLSLKPKLSQSILDFSVVYTPLHGTGLMPISRCLKELGYKNIYIVESQAIPDGNFSTVKSPNPEEHESFELGIELAEKVNADILLGTDPDADRVGVVVKDNKGQYKVLTGNQVGALLMQYILSSQKLISEKDAVIKTIVTSDLGARIAESFGASIFNTLTGFKYIGERIKQFEEENSYNFLFGYEESYGYLSGTFVRDKDAVSSSMLIVEMTAFYKSLGKTLYDVLQDLYKSYGFYRECLKTFTFKGVEGQIKINNIMEKARDFKSLKLFMNDIDYIEDYRLQKRIYIENDAMEEIQLPKSNVIKVCFINESWIAIRPSGTEPKLKIYFSAIGSSNKIAEEILNKLIKRTNEFLKLI